MKEKLSVRKVYRNAYKYVLGHLFAFFFLTFFYFIGSLLPLIFGTSSLFVVSTLYNYLFFYFAAGCYFKQQILWDRKIFTVAGLRFMTAIALFLVALLITTLAINTGIHFVKLLFNGAMSGFVEGFLDSSIWMIGKYLCIFLLFNVFFLIPSFAFVSEITGKNKSLLMTFAKTKGNILRISLTTAISVVLLLGVMFVLTYMNVFVASLVRAGILVFVSILYFKMYDFFYSYPIKKVKNSDILQAVKTTKQAKTVKDKELVGEVKTTKSVKASEDMEQLDDIEATKPVKTVKSRKKKSDEEIIIEPKEELLDVDER